MRVKLRFKFSRGFIFNCCWCVRCFSLPLFHSFDFPFFFLRCICMVFCAATIIEYWIEKGNQKSPYVQKFLILWKCVTILWSDVNFILFTDRHSNASRDFQQYYSNVYALKCWCSFSLPIHFFPFHHLHPLYVLCKVWWVNCENACKNQSINR